MTRRLQAEGRKVVFTNGCFDILHVGHIELLEAARRLGDVLIVGINSDASVRRLKGPHRPVTDETDRARILAALAVVDFVVVFGEDTPQVLIGEIIPDILVKGGDYNLDTIIGRDIVESHGGQIVVFPLVQGKSTSDLINKLFRL
ncbi:MAG: D-glycero-beta-D-manno-heptose 1-phosphate adenylyltransferase [Candidatus Neomarinimicrobiota bacterium]